MGHQSYVLLCTKTTLSNPPVVQPKSSCDVHLLRSPCLISQKKINKKSWSQYLELALMCFWRSNPGTMLLGLLIWPNHFYQCMVSARKYPPFLVSILISDLNQNTVVSQSGPGQSTGKKWWIVPLCTDEPHSRFVTEFCHVEMCAIHYLPKESEFGRPKNKWNILGIICPEFFWSHIFIFLCFFSWPFQKLSLSDSPNVPTTPIKAI